MPYSTGRPPFALVFLVLLVLASSGCHKKHTAVPVPSQPNAVPAEEAPPPQTQPAQPPPAKAPPVTTPAPVQTVPAKDETIYQKNKPAEQPPPPKRATRPAPPAAAPQGPAPTTTPPPPADSPHLADILTPDQQHEFNGAIDQSLSQAQTSIGSLVNRQLTKEQEATVAQVQNFIQQAQATRKNDLAAAKSLAERAEVLAHDLVESLK